MPFSNCATSPDLIAEKRICCQSRLRCRFTQVNALEGSPGQAMNSEIVQGCCRKFFVRLIRKMSCFLPLESAGFATKRDNTMNWLPGEEHVHEEVKTETATRKSSTKLQGKSLYVSDHVTCSSSRASVNKYVEFMIRHGVNVTTQAAGADLILVDTCAFSRDSEDSSIEVVKQQDQVKKDNAVMIVCGCLVAINPDRLRQNFRGEFFSPRNESHLAHILGVEDTDEEFFGAFDLRANFLGGTTVKTASSWKKAKIGMGKTLHQINDRIPLESIPFLDRLLASTHALHSRAACITIEQGCLGNCSFCVIPLAKGQTRSVPIGLIVDQVKKSVAGGVRDIVLGGEDTGSYGNDIRVTIKELLNKICDVEGKFRLYVPFFDPRWLKKHTEDIIEISKTGKLRYLQTPFQSVSNSVLRRMKRAYMMEQVLPFIDRLRNEAPQTHLATQIIVGFPGETDEEFQTTSDYFKANRKKFARVDIFPYSERPGAESATMDGKLPEEVIQRRVQQLRQVIGGLRVLQ